MQQIKIACDIWFGQCFICWTAPLATAELLPLGPPVKKSTELQLLGGQYGSWDSSELAANFI